jgi:hypothetical protein
MLPSREAQYKTKDPQRRKKKLEEIEYIHNTLVEILSYINV